MIGSPGALSRRALKNFTALLLVCAVAAAGVPEVQAAGIPFADLPKPYEDSGLIVSLPSAVIGGTLGAVVGALFIPILIPVAILPVFGLIDAVVTPMEWGWAIGVHTLGRIVGAPLWVIKKVLIDWPLRLLLGGFSED